MSPALAGKLFTTITIWEVPLKPQSCFQADSVMASWPQKQTYTWASQLCTWLQGHPGVGIIPALWGDQPDGSTGRPGEHCRRVSWGESMHLGKAGPSSRLPGWELQAWASGRLPKPRVPLGAPPGASTWPFLRRHRDGSQSLEANRHSVVRLCLQFMVEKRLTHISAVSSNTYQDIFDTLTSRVYRYTRTHINNFATVLKK